MSNNYDIPDEPPPPYEEAIGGSSNSHPIRPPALPPRHNTSTSKPSATTSVPSPSPATSLPHPHPPQSFAQLLGPAAHPSAGLVNRQFPPTVNLYRDALPSGVQRRYFLGEHQVSPLYAVGAWASWTGNLQASLVLHNGPSEDYPPLATVAYDTWGRRVDVSLPPLPGPGGSGSGQPVVVQMPRTGGGLGGGGGGILSHTVGFRVEVPWPSAGAGAGGGVTWRKEAYEWRPSNSLAVSGLGGSSQGWKLVRLANELPPGGLAVAGSGPPSGDGHEVVAVCTNAVMSMTKLWKFSFLGTGVSGALGERWAVMAVVTGLVIWDRDNRGR